MVDVIKLRILRWEISPGYPDGINIITSKDSCKKEVGGSGQEKEKM